jgi:hypothetical protein
VENNMELVYGNLVPLKKRTFSIVIKHIQYSDKTIEEFEILNIKKKIAT